MFALPVTVIFIKSPAMPTLDQLLGLEDMATLMLIYMLTYKSGHKNTKKHTKKQKYPKTNATDTTN